MSKRVEIKAQTKQNIIDSFWSLYCEKRIEKITVKDIMQIPFFESHPVGDSWAT